MKFVLQIIFFINVIILIFSFYSYQVHPQLLKKRTLQSLFFIFITMLVIRPFYCHSIMNFILPCTQIWESSLQSFFQSYCWLLPTLLHFLLVGSQVSVIDFPQGSFFVAEGFFINWYIQLRSIKENQWF